MADSSSLTLERLAIRAALEARWEDAIKTNLSILDNSPEDISALNRLGVAYLKSKQSSSAKKIFQQVLKIDHFNSIAKTNLKRVSPKFAADFDRTHILSNRTFSFIEEPGKSKVITLSHIGEPNIIGSLYTGLVVELKTAARKIKVVTTTGHYVGSLPDDIATHLIRLIKAGYKYSTLIKSADTNNVQVFIKEIKSSKKLRGIPSFTSTDDLDDLELSTTNQVAQPPLEIYDSETEE